MIDYSDLTDKALIGLRDFASSPAVRRAARVELQRRRDAAQRQTKAAELAQQTADKYKEKGIYK